MTDEFRREYRKAEGRLREHMEKKDDVVSGLGLIDKEIHETTRALAKKEHERAVATFTRPRTAEMDRKVAELTREVEDLQDGKESLEISKRACISMMRDLDDRIADEKNIMVILKVDE